MHWLYLLGPNFYKFKMLLGLVNIILLLILKIFWIVIPDFLGIFNRYIWHYIHIPNGIFIHDFFYICFNAFKYSVLFGNYFNEHNKNTSWTQGAAAVTCFGGTILLSCFILFMSILLSTDIWSLCCCYITLSSSRP